VNTKGTGSGTHSFSLERSLTAPASALPAVVARLGSERRVDLTGAPDGALAYLLHRAHREHKRPLLLLFGETSHADRFAANLRFFERPSGEVPRVLQFPAAETTPFVDVAPDRRVSMQRLSTLFHLAHGRDFAAVVAPVAAVLRRVPPKAAIQSASRLIKLGEQLDREALLQLLSECGYLRVPMVEDPGSFAVRGSLLDIYPPYAPDPSRIELDDDVVSAIRRFDPDDQRSLQEVTEVAIHPVRETLLRGEDLERAKEQLSDLCDAANMPSSKRRQLVEELGTGRSLLGIEGLLPAFYPALETLFDYLPKDVQVVVVDPPELDRETVSELDRAATDHDAKAATKAPVYPVSALYADSAELSKQLTARRLCVVHQLLVGGAHDADEDVTPLARTLACDADAALPLAAQDESPIAAQLRARRASKTGEDPLTPLVEYARSLSEEGMRVVLTAKTTSQAERLHGLLRDYGLKAAKPEPDGTLDDRNARELRILVGSLEDGFLLPSEALAVITEREIFGERAARAKKIKKSSDKARAFVEDLRELRTGDFVVHMEHGIGKYLGLDYKEVPVSRFEQLRGLTPKRVEVLVLEYAGSDKLYLPVTRLSQIEKFGGAEGAQRKLDRLGGQTFERTKARVQTAVKKLADELLALYAARRARTRTAYPPVDRHYAEFEAMFPYEETADQARAIDDVMSDLDSGVPMDRVVCGDVGFGKTEVAMRAAFRAALSGKQVAVLCPTTVLAQQHFLNFQERMRDYPLRVEVLSRFLDKKEQAAVVAKIKDGSCDIVIGTHRVLSKDVHWQRLGLLIVDEEQRFGVAHKERIKQLKQEVDVLTLSATPIPRTLQLAVAGMRELSIIATPPTDRRAVRTLVTRWDDHVVSEAIKRELSRGGQVFFVHNRIEHLHERASQLAQLVPEAKIAVAHGRMREGMLEQVMTDFVAGRYDILCSTAIVENGLDISRANTILIDRADHFGLSQLYQLRGRVGRSRERAYCYLIAPPESVLSDDARARIEALTRFSQLGSGFQVASLDMELRGAGDLLGAEQSGSVAAVGLDLFVQMLEEAVAELRGEPIVHEVDPELTLDIEHYLPDDYVSDVGLRLSLYKRFAQAPDEDALADISSEMEDRFGPPPEPALAFIRAMGLKPPLRALRVLGCEATASRVTLHLRNDCPLPAPALVSLVSRDKRYQITPDLRLTRRFTTDEQGDAIDRVRVVLGELRNLLKPN
jgi:transcription-repair coupling factor (superfamily II helicase)